MNKLVYSLMLAGVLAAGVRAKEEPVLAKLQIGNTEWDVTLLERNGEMVKFRRVGRVDTPEFPISTIKGAVFEVDIDQYELETWYDNREYGKIISALEQALKPYEPYSDIRSNLTQYYDILMELYYKRGAYDKCLSMARRIANDDRDPELQRKGYVFQGLTLIETGKIAEAEALFKMRGWNEELPDDAPPEDVFITAKFQAMKKEYAKALETVAKIIAFDSQNVEWMRPAELLCARMYTELGMLDSADEVIREITLLYKNTDEEEQAQELKVRVDKMRAARESATDSEKR